MKTSEKQFSSCNSSMVMPKRWLLFILLLSVQQLWADCGVNAKAVNFGNYDVSSQQDLDGTGWIDVTCSPGAAYRISISPGGGSFRQRKMSSSRDLLLYNLFTNATHTVVWGDGTGGTAMVAGKGVMASHTVHGRVPAGQIRDVGNYNDTLIVTIIF